MLVHKCKFLLQLLLKITTYFPRFYSNKYCPSYEFLVVFGQVRFETEKVRGGRRLGLSAGRLHVTSVRVLGGSGRNFSNSCGCRAGLKFAGAGRVRTKNFNLHRTLLTRAKLRHMHYNIVCDIINRTVFISHHNG